MFWIFWHKNQLNIFISYFYHSRSTLKILSHGAFGILIVCNHVICIYRLRTNCTMSLRCIITLQHSISGHTINRKGKTLLMIKVMCQVFNQWIFFSCLLWSNHFTTVAHRSSFILNWLPANPPQKRIPNLCHTSNSLIPLKRFTFYTICVFQYRTIPNKVKLLSVVLLSSLLKRQTSKVIPVLDSTVFF